MDKAAVLAEIDEVFRRTGATAERPFVPRSTPYTQAAALKRGEREVPVPISASAMGSAVLAAIERNAPHPSYVQAAREIGGGGVATTATADRLLGILASVRQDIEAGYIRTLEDRARGAVFHDFLEMAEHVLATIHAAPAAVLAGAVMEQHVRKLAGLHERNALVTAKGRPRAFEDLITDLARPGVIHESERKLLAAWYGQRTDAAHGHFAKSNDREVQRMIEGVREFVVRHPA